MFVFREPMRAEAARLRPAAEGLGEGRDLDRVAEGGARAVGLHVRDRVGIDPARACASAIASAWPSTLGAVKLTLDEPSLLSAAPLMTA